MRSMRSGLLLPMERPAFECSRFWGGHTSLATGQSVRPTSPGDPGLSDDPHPLSGSTALVTGGAGTIGSTIVDQLLAAGVTEVRVLDNLVRGREANLRDVLDDPA